MCDIVFVQSDLNLPLTVIVLLKEPISASGIFLTLSKGMIEIFIYSCTVLMLDEY